MVLIRRKNYYYAIVLSDFFVFLSCAEIIKVIIDEEYSALTSWKSEFNSIPLDVIYMNSNYLKEIKENFKEIILNHEKNILNSKNGK